MLLDVAGAFQHAVAAFVPDRASFGPTAAQVGVGQAPDEVPRQARAAVGHAVGFQKTQALLVPNFSLNGYLLAQERARTSAAKTAHRLGLE